MQSFQKCLVLDWMFILDYCRNTAWDDHTWRSINVVTYQFNTIHSKNCVTPYCSIYGILPLIFLNYLEEMFLQFTNVVVTRPYTVHGERISWQCISELPANGYLTKAASLEIKTQHVCNYVTGRMWWIHSNVALWFHCTHTIQL